MTYPKRTPRTLACIITAATLCAQIASAQQNREAVTRDLASTARQAPAQRTVVGLALEGGGALGFAHIGVLQWMEENHVPIDRIAGTSMGALVGSLWASGKSAAEVEAIAETTDFQRLFSLRQAYANLDFRRRENRVEMPGALVVGLKNGPSLQNALVPDAGLLAFLHSNLLPFDRASTDFDQLPTPFRCVATDLNTMEPVVFGAGPLTTAVRASISIPGVFAPVEVNRHFLVDGAIMNNLPTDVVRRDMHADVVIGVQLDAARFDASDVNSIVGTFARAYSVGTARNERIAQQSTDVLIHVKSGSFSATDYNRAAELIRLGYQAAEQMRGSLQKYSLGPADWNDFKERRDRHKHTGAGILLAARVDGSSQSAQKEVLHDLKPLQNEPVQAASVTAALAKVEAGEVIRADYDTFDGGVYVHLRPMRNGPPFLLFLPDLTFVSGNVSRAVLDFRLLQTNFGGFGSELRTNVRVGFLTDVSSEYYRRLTTSGLYIEPRIGLERQPVYLWRDQVRVSEHLQQQAGGGLEIGRTFNRTLQLGARYDAQVVRWHPVSGIDRTTPVSGTAQTALIHFVYDARSEGGRGEGLRINLSAGGLYHSVASSTAPLVRATMSESLALPAQGMLSFSADANSYLRHVVAEPLRFTLGGPFRLSASSVDEYRATDTVLLRSAYSRRIASLPTGYGQGLYAGMAYEAGEAWAPERHALLRQDGVLTLVAVTPLGNFTAGSSVGDAGRRKVFFTVGRLF